MSHVMQVTRAAWEDAMRVVRGETPTHTHLRDRVIAIVTITLIVDLFASVAILFLERHATNTEITNFGDSIFWVTTQLLTVSSQLHNPITPGARLIDILLEAISISVVATLAGSFAAFFHRRGNERDEADAAKKAS
jgi:ABC-type phosphate/phosphonate transport system permease subunit